jgi:competence protein ComEC
VQIRFMAAMPAGWLAGIALQLQQAAVWPWAAYAAMAASVALAVVATAWLARATRLRRAGAHRTLTALAVALAAAALAFALTGWRAAERLADALDPAADGVDVVLTGVVDSLPQRLPTGLRWTFAVDEARTRQGQTVRVPARVSLAWYSARPDGTPLPTAAGTATAGPQALEPRAGERWRLPVRLRPPHGLANPHGFDFELWLFERGVRATGYVRTAGPLQAERLGAAEGRWVLRVRQHLRDGIERRIADARAAGVVAALAIGDQAAIARDDWDVFRTTGVAHLMAISGLHVTMFAWLAAAVVRRAWRLSPRAMLAWPAPSAARWLGLAAAAAYALLAGWGVPAQRTVWMLATVTVLPSLGVHWPWAMVLLTSACVVTALDPWALLQPGFWLSFVAVGLLMASQPADDAIDSAATPVAGSPVRQFGRRLATAARGGVRTQLIATFGLAPLTLVLFQQVSLVGLLANLVAVPLVTLLITPVSLLGALLPPLWPLAGWMVLGLGEALSMLARAPWAVLAVAAAPGWAQALGLLAGALLVLPLPWRTRALAVPLAWPMLWPAVERPPEGRFDVVAADVGQGSAVLVRTRGHTLLYDSGARYSAASDAGQRVLLPLLRGQGVRQLDAMVLSHSDSDHIGGADSVLAVVPAERIVSSLPPAHALAAPRRGTAVQTCRAGQQWQWDGVRFEMLHPLASDYEAAQLSANAMSCVLSVSDARGARLLLTGDIPVAVESRLVERAGSALAADVLLAPHHGSRSSSGDELLDAVQPRLALVQAGWRNRFGHPAAEVLARLQARGVGVVRTDQCGAWQWRSGAGNGRCHRAQTRRYWHDTAVLPSSTHFLPEDDEPGED